MDVTVAICTWNRCELLNQTLDEMCKLEIPPDLDWELIIVNNNCSDATEDVIDAYQQHLPIRRLFESRQGLSNARNCAAAAAKGDLIIWTDDDVLVDPTWISEYVTAAHQWPDAAFFGGTVDPWFSIKPPKWILPHLDLLFGVYAIRQLGNDIMKINSIDDLPFGANMAMRKHIFNAMAFNPSLGHCGTNLLCSEEAEFMSRLMERGYYGVWVGTARVRHYIPIERLTTKYIWEVFRGYGQSNLRANEVLKKKMQRRFRHQVRKYYKARLKSWFLYPFKGRSWIRAFMKAAIQRGMIDELHAVECTRNDGVP